jgi:hypothetical protein
LGTTLFTCLVEERDTKKPFIQVYWARDEHLGGALEKMQAAARGNGLLYPAMREADPFDLRNLACEVEPEPTAEVFWAVGRHFFPPEPTFRLPYGVIGSCLEGERDINEIVSGYTLRKSDQGLSTLEVNADADDLAGLYEQFVQAHPSYRVFWYQLHDHWQNDGSDTLFLVNEGVNTPARIMDHLQTHPLDSILNGFVTLTAYLEEGSTNVSISDHKRIVVTTYSDRIAAGYTDLLDSTRYDRFDALASIDRGVHHWHYRHPASRDRVGLERHLRDLEFQDWKPKR